MRRIPVTAARFQASAYRVRIGVVEDHEGIALIDSTSKSGIADGEAVASARAVGSTSD